MPEEHEGTPAPAAPVVNAVPELTQPVIDHAGKIAALEERQAKHQEDLARQLGELEERYTRALAEHQTQLSAQLDARIAAIEEAMSRAAKAAEDVPEEAPEEAEELVEDAVEVPRVAEKPHGRRRRRKARRNK